MKTAFTNKEESFNLTSVAVNIRAGCHFRKCIDLDAC